MTTNEILEAVKSGKMSVDDAMKVMPNGQPPLTCKVGEKGGLSVYGLGRFPVTLYIGQWERLWSFTDDMKKFAKSHSKELTRKES